MAQFDVHPNPIRAARAAYPWVAVMQSPFADASRERIVAPLVRRDAFPASAPAGSLARHRVEILAAIDYLFFGI